MAAADVYIGLGSNIGDAAANCRQALAALEGSEGVRLLGASALYRSEPLGVTDQAWFVNGIAAIETILEPLDLLAMLKDLERRLGRQPGARWGPRLIDLDLLLYGQRVLQSTILTVPHPLMHERRFVLEPLCALAPRLVHPRLASTMQQLLTRLPEGQCVEILGD